MIDILDQLALSTLDRIRSGYYHVEPQGQKTRESRSFVHTIKKNVDPVVAEIKPRSPTEGKLSTKEFNPVDRGLRYLNGGALGLSVLTEPDYFHASLDNLQEVSTLGKPTLMKDFVLDYPQIEAGSYLGADAILLIYRLFTRNYPTFSIDEAIDYAHKFGLEVLLETSDKTEYLSALKTDAEMIGVNNRDLRTLQVDLSTTKNILSDGKKDRIFWSMSGIEKREDIVYLREAGADAFLVGSSLTKSQEPENLLRKLRGV